MFECEKCCKSFTTKQSLIYHLNKVICDKLNKIKFKCNECEKVYTSQVYLDNHIKKYHQADEKTKVDILEKELNDLKEFVKLNMGIKSGDIITTNNMNNNNNIYIQQVVLNPFDCENTKYIKDDMWLKCIKTPHVGLPDLIAMINFDPKHPENHNIILPNKSKKVFKVFDGEEWISKNREWIIENLLRCNTYRIGKMFEISQNNGHPIFDNNKNKIDADILSEWLDKAEKALDNNDEDSKKLIENIKLKITDGCDNINKNLKMNPIKYIETGKVVKKLVD